VCWIPAVYGQVFHCTGFNITFVPMYLFILNAVKMYAVLYAVQI